MLLPKNAEGSGFLLNTTTLLPGGVEEGKSVTTMMFRKTLPKYAVLSTVLSKIVGDSSPEFYFVLP